ncbi:chitin disaccharide deacetylase [Neobacillus sp. CF12]|uniref:chitin disaccharide deacetylase n=1 Tax=Neobacillus sp. CF12 TaxID=3055864 RepID=UPI0025A1158D|nr:chitin disaccharide deacetylase [Neobacillus sp. CF12]MDM5326425.1 chitin disaccharide deacetylase [Neobacillus sp. CF12]
MIKLIVNADDFGYSRGINYGIIDAHKYGIVNSATMMMNMPGVSHAVEMAKENLTLQLGIHLVLTCGRPLLSDVPSLMDVEGNFKKMNDIIRNHNLSLMELEREWTAQIDRFFDFGLTATHFDSHHHVHSIPEFLPVIQRLSKKYNLPVRRISEQPVEGVPSFTDRFFHDFYGEGVSDDYFVELSKHDVDNQTIEVMCHPGYLDFEVLNGSSYTADRVKETNILTSVTLPDNIILL